MEKTLVVIPARMQSSRLPGKPLRDIDGIPLLMRTYIAASRLNSDHIAVATSDVEICKYCQDNSIYHYPTSPNLPTGTHRCAALLKTINEHKERCNEFDVVVNWQCDEPFVRAEDVSKLIDACREGALIATLYAPLVGLVNQYSKNMIKTMVLNKDHNFPRCHWFSREPMRDAYGHVGVYAFQASALLQLGELPETELSKSYSLEQLAWIEDGYRIHATKIENLPLSINSEADLTEMRENVSGETVEGTSGVDKDDSGHAPW